MSERRRLRGRPSSSFLLLLGSSRGGVPVPRIRLVGNSVAEDAEVGDLIGVLSVANSPEGVTWVFTLGDGAPEEVALDESDDTRLEVAGPLDHETQPTLSPIPVIATPSEGDPISRTFTIQVTDVAEPEIVLSQTTFAEDDGPLLATVSIINGEPGAEYEIEIVESDPSDLFALDGDDFEVVTNLDYETAPNPTVTMRFRRTNPEGEWSEPQILPLTVTNVLEVTLGALTLDTDEIEAGSAEDTVVGELQGVSSGSTLSLIDDAGGKYKISGNNVVAGDTPTTEGSDEITVRETHDDGTNSPRDTVIEITVLEEDTAPDLTANLISFWELEEESGTRVDSHGSNDLTDNNTVTQNTGKVGNAAVFAQANSESLSITDNADLSYSGDFSFAAWINSPNASGSGGQVGGKTGAFANNEWYLKTQFTSTRVLRFTTFDSGGGEFTLDDVVTIGNSVWQLGIVTYTASTKTMTLSTNAGTRVTRTITGDIADKTGLFTLGANHNGTSFGSFWDGLIDQVGFWKRALTEEEETWLYNSGNGRSYSEILATAA